MKPRPRPAVPRRRGRLTVRVRLTLVYGGLFFLAGLGLSIVQAVAGSHGGRVHARPRTGGGLVVTVTLPGAAQPPDPEPTLDDDADLRSLDPALH